LALTGEQEQPTKRSPIIPLLVVIVTGGALIYGTLDMPHYGDPNAAVHMHPDPSFVERSLEDMHGLPNVVTALLASYRGYDTLGETTVVLTAGIAVLLILRRDELERPAIASRAKRRKRKASA
ncbi:hydrogen gas-evolving membrane-bound hydrogenase subunit E, partial [Rhodopirellula bahusiensis]